MKDSARYVKIVEWSHEDQCYVGSAPGLIFGGCHGDDEKAVFDDAKALKIKHVPVSARAQCAIGFRWVDGDELGVL